MKQSRWDQLREGGVFCPPLTAFQYFPQFETLPQDGKVTRTWCKRKGTVWTCWGEMRMMITTLQNVLGFQAKFWQSSKFCQNPFRKYCRYRYGFTLLGKHHISRGHSRDLSKELSGFEMIWYDNAHFFHFHVHLKNGNKSNCKGSRTK